MPTIGAATASVLLHAAPLAVLLLLPSASIYGVSSKPSEDVSLETLVTVDVEAVDSIETIKPPAAAIDQMAVPATPPSPEVRDPEEMVDQVVREEPRPKEQEIEPHDRPANPPPSLAAVETIEPADIVRSERIAPPAAEPPARAPAKPSAPPVPAQTPAPAVAPSVASRGPAPGAPGSHKATASRGDLLAYAGLIRGRLSKRKPKTRGHVGTVVVAFGIAPSGLVSFATIERKSGVPVLDEAALKAVREAGPFPPTPDGRDHAFVLPFEFR